MFNYLFAMFGPMVVALVVMILMNRHYNEKEANKVMYYIAFCHTTNPNTEYNRCLGRYETFEEAEKDMLHTFKTKLDSYEKGIGYLKDDNDTIIIKSKKKKEF